MSEPLPRIPVPLAVGEQDGELDLQSALATTYDAFAFDEELNYRLPPEIPLSQEDAQWAAQILGIPRG